MVRVRESGRGINPNSKIGRRTVLGWQFFNGSSWFVVTRCECGRIQAVDTSSLVSGRGSSCTCSRAIPPSEIFRVQESGRGIGAGSKIGRRTILGWQFSRGRDKQGKTQWAAVVECECGNLGIADIGELVRGHAESCGCLIADSKTKHGFNSRSAGRHRLYSTWVSMRTRCNYEGSRHWHRYGGRGIKVCPEWDRSDGFPAFMEWAVANGWQSTLQIDRIDNDGNYEPSNCRWVTPLRNARNRGNVRKLTAFGETKTLREWIEDSRCAVVNVDTLRDRVKRGWSDEKAITEPATGSCGSS